MFDEDSMSEGVVDTEMNERKKNTTSTCGCPFLVPLFGQAKNGTPNIAIQKIKV